MPLNDPTSEPTRPGTARPGAARLAARRLALQLRERVLSEWEQWTTDTRTVFVLSGGGNLGAVQVGMLRALAEAGIVPDLVLGCSVGAINGAAFAADPTPAGVDRLERIWLRLARGEPDLMPNRGLLPLAAQAARKGTSVHDPEPLRRLLSEELPVETFAELAVPFACPATDLDTAEEYWFERGPLVPALMASAALPAIFPPVMHEGRRLFDGGVVGEMPIARAIESGATELFLLQVGHLDKMLEIRRPFDVAIHAYWTARQHRLEEDVRAIPDDCTVHRLPAGGLADYNRFDDFAHAATMIARSRAATAHYLETRRTAVGGGETR